MPEDLQPAAEWLIEFAKRYRDSTIKDVTEDTMRLFTIADHLAWCEKELERMKHD